MIAGLKHKALVGAVVLVLGVPLGIGVVRMLVSTVGPPSDGTVVVSDGTLAPCPSSPNCVSSEADAGDEEHRVEPFRLAAEAGSAWSEARAAVAAMPRTTIVAAGDTALRAECRSFVFRFVDDLDLVLRADEGRIDVRSASRIGRSDLGVNRRRVEALRAELARRGAVAPAD